MRSRAAVFGWVLLAVSLLGAPAARAQEEAPPADRPADPLAALADQLDNMLSLAPADTCFTLSHNGTTIHRHNGDRDLMPASTQKLVTAAAALEVLGADHTFSTRAVAAAPHSGGVIEGDLHLVGGGDPLLVTDAFRMITDMGDEEHPTRFEALAEQIVASGVTRITGGVIGDESRFDAERTVATWPDRYVSQGQSGPLSALTVDDGYRIELPPADSDRSPVWNRSQDPAAEAARLLHDHLRVRGVEIGAEPTSGPAEAAGVGIASVDSAALPDVLSQLLVESDNQTGELLLKEMGRESGAGGSTAGGIEAVGDALGAMGLTPADVTIADGSGLDRGNRISCDDLVTLLDASGGPGGVIGQALPLAGSTGTLRRRFADTPLVGRLRAKTGRLSDVTALAGFTPMSGDAMATFAYVSNGETVTADLMSLQEHILSVVSMFPAPCTGDELPPVAVPLGPLAGQVMLLGPATGPLMVATATLVPLPVVAEHPAMGIAGCGGQSSTPRFETVSFGPGDGSTPGPSG